MRESLLTASALAVSVAAVADAPTPPTSSASHRQGSADAVRVAKPATPTMGREEARQKARDRRLTQGKRPAGEQLAQLATATGKSAEQAKAAASVALTWERPMPLDVFRQSREPGGPVDLRDLPPGTSGTVYLETDAGMPVQYTGPVDSDLVRAVAAFLTGPIRENAGKTYRSDAETQSAQATAADAAAATADIEERVVVLGLTLEYGQYEKHGQRIGEAVDIAATEVSLGTESSFTPTGEPFTKSAVSTWRSYYNEGN